MDLSTREYAADLPEVRVPKHQVLQIMINLIRNAQKACDGLDVPNRRVTVAVSGVQDGHWVRMAVRDQGVGMSAETQARLFNHGFTTRADGHGFGLHNSAAMAKELGGSLTGHSDGPGKGATFVLEFPCQPPTATGP